jgi:hypothetical protein
MGTGLSKERGVKHDVPKVRRNDKRLGPVLLELCSPSRQSSARLGGVVSHLFLWLALLLLVASASFIGCGILPAR